MMPEVYPSTYPCPSWQYAQNITAHQKRTPMECGWVRQRKRWPSTGIAVDLTFEMDTATFATWRTWINQYGYNWFTIDLDYFGAGLEATDIRLTSQITYQYRNFDQIIVTVSGEFEDGDA